ncbi:methyltransferase domain-containing protein [Achromobacter sp. NFACC18-2]|uniref:class I SAM-dependent methyltransferase n=1 Tax=Achromobacter sp. NFACC18-2 TaxID=1564112 RepID=UPI0008BE7968|nr:methyltransferase domain-containing protein [Achromobacter sp. NFACC18-2]SEK10477.1 Methyltransferase domain-containing protein [Achromobacter sp. NFACC18-2]
MHEATILDPCCGGRMMWFDRQDQRALFGDIRSEEHTLCDGRVFSITPDLNMDFRAMPFPDESFRLVAFDPPHLRHAGRDSWLRAKYGILGDDWQEDLRRGFAECFRVLKPEGVLIFKWNAIQIRTPQILALTPHKPLFGHPSGKRADTHWMTFMKPHPDHKDGGANGDV